MHISQSSLRLNFNGATYLMNVTHSLGIVNAGSHSHTAAEDKFGKNASIPAYK